MRAERAPLRQRRRECWASPIHRRACKRCCTGCTLHNSHSLSFIVHPFQNVLPIFQVSLGLLVKSVNFEVHFILASSSHESFKQSRQIQVQKSVVRRLHAIFRSKVAGSPGGGVTRNPLLN
uniref:Uncharacterized protein n=1 Tax=Cucumis melo TaxID=3656 RepID=A0A9I9EBA6_CUCME